MSNPAQIDSKRIYTGRVINLDIDRVRFPNGSSGELEIIRHPGASAVVPFLTEPTSGDPRVLLLKQYRYAAGGYLYEIPAGRLDLGELPEACARRELAEETGCTATSMKFLTSVYTTPGFTDECIHLFMATGLIRGEPHHEADEFIQVEVMPLSQALDLIRRGEIKDAKTTLALLFAAGFPIGL
jgi:ADP-ribose pyrophosphatase